MRNKPLPFKNQADAVSGYRLSKLADEDLLSIFRYTIETWGADQVSIYLHLLEAARDQIAQNPHSAGSKSREDLAPGCRIFRSGQHYFVYRIKGGIVEIARILHESMDFERHVGDQDFD